MTVSKKVGALIGTAIGVAVAGTAIAVGVTTSRKKQEQPKAKLGELRPDREYTVVTEDGIELSVEEVDPVDGGKPALTVVFVHGFALDRRCWHFQRQALARLAEPRVRQVLYDQRSHGRSSRANEKSSSIDQLGRDLGEILTKVDGPVVLVGHSMGGMTIMALAEQQPELFEDQVWGVAFVGTSAGEVGKRGLPRPLLSRYNPLTRNLGRLADWQPGLVEFVRAAGGQLTRRAVRSLAFGSKDVDPAVVGFTMEMLDANPVRVLADFIATLGTHNRYAALAGLKHTHVLVLSGDADRMTDFAHAERIAVELPDAELVRVRGAGHMVMLEEPQVVNDHLVMLLQQSAYGRDGRGAFRWVVATRMTVELPTENDTLRFGRRIGSLLEPGDLVLLSGPLGAGKTVLAKGIAAGLGVEGRVSSPTFIIAREHRPAPGGKGIPLVHVDAYRLGNDLAQLDDLDLDTELVEAAVVVEWGEAAERLSEDHLLIALTRCDDDTRLAEVRPSGKWEKRWPGV